jgi:hypothetical protein
MALDCKDCVHYKICGAQVDMRSFIERWNRKYPGLEFSEEQNLAETCRDYKSISDLHIKESLNYRQFTELVNQINELIKKQNNLGVTKKEKNELSKAISDAKIIYRELDESEKLCADNYSRFLTGNVLE